MLVKAWTIKEFVYLEFAPFTEGSKTSGKYNVIVCYVVNEIMNKIAKFLIFANAIN